MMQHAYAEPIEAQVPARPILTLIPGLAIEQRSRSFLSRAENAENGNLLRGLAWLKRHTNSVRSDRANAQRAYRILATQGKIFCDSVGLESAEDVAFFVRSGAIEFRVRPACPEESYIDHAGYRAHRPCTHGRRAFDCKRPWLGAEGTYHQLLRLEAMGENHK